MTSRQGRRERPVDPEDGPVQAFAWGLRQLRVDCGTPTYKEMARHASYSSSALSGAAGGQAPPSLEVALAYVSACLRHARADLGRVAAAQDEWASKWHELQSRLAPPAAPAPTSTPAPATGTGTGTEPTGPVGEPLHRTRRWYRRRPAAVGLLVLVLVLAGVSVLIGRNVPRPGPAEAATGLPGQAPAGSSPLQAREQVDRVQVDALGPPSRCGPVRPATGELFLRACVRVEDDEVLFALKIMNLGPHAVEVTTKLAYAQSGRYHSCPRADGLWHGTVPAHDTHVTEPTDCVTARAEPAAYQADGLLALGNGHEWIAHQLSPNAHVHPRDVLWRCKGDVPC
ncbi:hypothetical protein [Streptomyces sp. NPDC056160]|uniref:hypothetical protein n=1 Tax=Streptomyces sp. NPDC056160 TaxID=3345731 RepID=UPI0035D91E4A